MSINNGCHILLDSQSLVDSSMITGSTIMKTSEKLILLTVTGYKKLFSSEIGKNQSGFKIIDSFELFEFPDDHKVVNIAYAPEFKEVALLTIAGQIIFMNSSEIINDHNQERKDEGSDNSLDNKEIGKREDKETTFFNLNRIIKPQINNGMYIFCFYIIQGFDNDKYVLLAQTFNRIYLINLSKETMVLNA